MLRDSSAYSDDDAIWADRSEFWANYRPARKKGPPRKYRYREPLVLCGHGIRIRVDHNTLLIRNGLTHHPQKVEEFRFFPGEANLPGRIVVLDGSGGATFDAMHWMAEQSIEFVRLGWDGNPISIFGNSGYSADPKMVEAQKAAKIGRQNFEIANWLIDEKLKASLATLISVVPKSELRDFAESRIKNRISEIRNSKNPISIPKLFGIEGDCAKAYFRAWAEIPIQWKGLSRKPIPAEWHTVGSRMMSWRKRTQNARHPINAMLNYGYGILAHQIRSQVLAVGLDPTIGVIHGNYENPMPLVYDLMEPIRPMVDKLALEFAMSRTFEPGDFSINSLGGCRLNPQMAKNLISRIGDVQSGSPVRQLVVRLSGQRARAHA